MDRTGTVSQNMQKVFVFIEQYRNPIVHGCALFFLVAGLIYSYSLGETLRYPDAQKYYTVAVNVASGNGYSVDGVHPTAFFVPVWPLVLALFIKLGAPIWLLRYLNFIFLAACVYIIRSILRRKQAEAGAPIAGILLIGYGVLFYTAGTLYTQTLATLEILLIVHLVIGQPFGYGRAVALGGLSALLILTHPSGVFIPPLVVFWLLLPKNFHLFQKTVVSALVAVLLISIWSYRNYTAFDRFIPITSHGADTLYFGNNPDISLDAWYTYFYEDEYKEVQKMSEPEQNSYYLHKTLEFWSEQPGVAIKLYLTKLVDYFNFYDHLYVEQEFNLWRRVIMFITYYPLLLCLILRLIFSRRVPLSKTEKLLVAIYITSALFYAVFLPRIRFRLPFDAVLIAHIGIMYSLLRSSLLPGQPSLAKNPEF